MKILNLYAGPVYPDMSLYQMLIRNEVNYQLGKHILQSALRKNLFEFKELLEQEG